MDNTKVSAVIVSWKRPQEVGKIVENLHQYDFIDEIIIAVNKPDDNKKCYKRWLSALRAKNNTIYTQDDDCIVGNLQELYDQYDGSRMIIGLKQERMKNYLCAESAMVGWGTFLDKSWINFDKYKEKYGEDELLIRESDRILTYIINKDRQHYYAVSNVIDFPSANGEMAMFLEPEHYNTRDKSIKRVEELYD